MNRWKAASFIVSLFFCVDTVNYPSKTQNQAMLENHNRQNLLYFTLTRKFKYNNTLNKYLVLYLGQKLSKKSFQHFKL